jgi:hypothetical protein
MRGMKGMKALAADPTFPISGHKVEKPVDAKPTNV